MDACRLLNKKDILSYVPVNSNEAHIVNAITHFIKTGGLKIHGKMKQKDAKCLEKAFGEFKAQNSCKR